MNFPDRLICFLVGHTWERVSVVDAVRCPHCTRQINALEQISIWRRRGLQHLSGHAILTFLPVPKRVW